MANTPEELEQIRAYGQALLGAGHVPQEQPVRVGEYGAVSPLSIVTRGLQSLQGRSALNFVESERTRQRRERASSIPGVGDGTPGLIQPQAQPTAVSPQTPQPQQPNQQASTTGMPGERFPGYVNTLAALESSNNPNASVANGRQVPENQARYFGLGMFSRDLLQRYNVTNWRDPNQQRRAIAEHLESNNAEYRRVFGQDLPTPGHGYLMHQQGPGGGVALLQNPNETAFNVLMRLPFYRGNASLVRSAIENNLPANLKGQWRNIRAGDFANQWINRFNQRAGFNGSQPQTDVATSGQPPVQPASAPAIPPNAQAAAQPNPIETGAIPPTQSPIAPEQSAAAPEAPTQEPSIQLAQAETGEQPNRTPPNYINGVPSDLPPGVPQAIAPDPQMRGMSLELQTIANQLRRPELLSGEEFNKLLDSYQEKLKAFREISAPINVNTAFGTATYDRASGRLLNFVPSVVNREVTFPGGSSRQQLIWDRGRLRVVPIAPFDAPNSGAQGGGQLQGSDQPRQPNPNVSPQLPPFPQTGEIADEAAWGQRTQALGAAAQDVARAQGQRLSTAITQGTQASERVAMLNAIRTATRAIARDRLSGERLSQYQTIFEQYFRNFGPVSNLGFREFLDKLNAFLASEATQEISARGTNFEFSTLMRYNPNLFASHEGTMMLIDYLIQEKKKQEALGNRAANLGPEEFGNWGRIVEDYNRDHPIIIRMPLPNGTTMNITSRPIPNVGDLRPDGRGVYTEQDVKDVLDSIPRGQWFINPRTGLPTPTVPPTDNNRSTDPQTPNRRQRRY